MDLDPSAPDACEKLNRLKKSNRKKRRGNNFLRNVYYHFMDYSEKTGMHGFVLLAEKGRTSTEK